MYVLAVASLPSQRPIQNVKHEQTPAPTGSRMSHQQFLFCKSVQIFSQVKEITTRKKFVANKFHRELKKT